MNILKLNSLIIKKPFCKDEIIIRLRNVYDKWYISEKYGNHAYGDFYKVFFEDEFVTFLSNKELDYLIENEFIEIRGIK